MLPDWLKNLGLIGILFFFYVIFGGFRASYVSGFKFYFTVALLESVPFILMLSYCIILPGYVPFWAVLVVIPVYLISALGSGWKTQQENKTREAFPSKWDKWESTVKQSSLLDRVLFYPIIRRRK